MPHGDELWVAGCVLPSFLLRSSSPHGTFFCLVPRKGKMLMFSPALVIGFGGFLLYVVLDISLNRVASGSA